MAVESDLVRQHADLLVLSVLADAPLYGYAISKEVAAKSDGRIRLTPGVLYPLLHKLEKQKLLLSSWDEVRAEDNVAEESEDGGGGANSGGGGRKRKWYRLSAKGKKKLEQRIVSHRAYQKLIESFIPEAHSNIARSGEAAL